MIIFVFQKLGLAPPVDVECDSPWILTLYFKIEDIVRCKGWVEFDLTDCILDWNTCGTTASIANSDCTASERERFAFKGSSLATSECRCRSESGPPADWKPASFQPPSMRWHKGAAVIRTPDILCFPIRAFWFFRFFSLVFKWSRPVTGEATPSPSSVILKSPLACVTFRNSPALI